MRRTEGEGEPHLAAIALVTPTLAAPLSFNQVLNTSIVAHLENIPTFQDIGRVIFSFYLLHFTRYFFRILFSPSTSPYFLE